MDRYDAALYIHIPYCSRKCDYCDFYSVTDYSHCSDTVTRIGRQVKEDKERYGIDSFLSVYIGGGTPGSLSPELLTFLLSSIRESNGGSLPSEVSLECNPENVTASSLAIWQEAGINRVSLGIQTFRDKFLKLAGRRGSRRVTQQALKFLSRRDGLEISLDLIQGLPGMTPEDQLADLEEAIDFGPDHLSWYTLTLEEGTVLADRWRERQTADLSAEENEQIWQEGCLLLEKAGYKRYEVSNFARPGRMCRHNRAYWEMRPYLGCGPGAVSMLPDSRGVPQRHRVVKDAAQYGKGILKEDNLEPLSPEIFLKDYLLMGLRMAQGIDLAPFRRIFGTGPEALFPRSLARWGREGLLRKDAERLKASPEGLDMLNSLLISLFDELDERPFAGTLHWPLPMKPVSLTP